MPKAGYRSYTIKETQGKKAERIGKKKSRSAAYVIGRAIELLDEELI